VAQPADHDPDELEVVLFDVDRRRIGFAADEMRASGPEPELLNHLLAGGVAPCHNRINGELNYASQRTLTKKMSYTGLSCTEWFLSSLIETSDS